MRVRTRPYGSWASPVDARALVAQSVSLSEVRAGRGGTWWAESRPTEQGRIQLVRRSADGRLHEVLPDRLSARTRVHEYGGGAWWLRSHESGDDVVFAEWESQRLMLLRHGENEPVALTPECGGRQCFADGRVTPDGRWSICVRERAVGDDSGHHPPGEPVSEIVAVRLEPLNTDGDDPVVLVRGADFHASPRLSADGRRLAFVRWYHPHMPWDATELCVVDLLERNGVIEASEPVVVAGGAEESISEPHWIDGDLLFIGDRTGWWNIHRVEIGSGRVSPVAVVDADLGVPHWVFDNARIASLADGRIVVCAMQDGVDHLGVVHDGGVRFLPTKYTAFASLRADGDGVVVVASSMTDEAAVVRIDGFGRFDDVDAGVASDPRTEVLRTEVLRTEVLRAPRPSPLSVDSISLPESISFPSADGRFAHALFYPPRNAEFRAPEGERPPLLVLSHGGPTSAARSQFSIALQYWTSRGFAVVDVNYAGSTGFGRAFRRSLDGRWGIADVEDCVAAARHLVTRGDVDGERLVIRGGSAGGFTTLCALTFTDEFDAGCSLYGIADLEALVTDTHKFESRYLDSLVGPHPERRDLYRSRSPIHHTDRLSCPVIVLQGLDDRVVPPAQAEQLVAALEAKGIAHAYLPFEGEGHGFRRAETIVRAIEAEASFYSQVLGFELDDPVVPVEVRSGADRRDRGPDRPFGADASHPAG